MKKTYYYIYEITNLINGKTYIGQHITDYLKDGYMGSGNAIKKAILKYGKENFKKEILMFAVNQVALNFMEMCLVTEAFINYENNYNAKVGGGGSGKLSKEGCSKISKALTGIKRSDAFKARVSEIQTGKKASLETKLKMSAAQKGLKKPRSKECVDRFASKKILNGKLWTISDIGRQNMSSSRHKKLSNDDILQVENLLLSGMTQRAIAKQFNLSCHSIINNISKKLQKREGLKFKPRKSFNPNMPQK